MWVSGGGASRGIEREGAGGGGEGDVAEWTAETGKRGNPGRLRGNPVGIVSASRGSNSTHVARSAAGVQIRYS